jgi:transposase-like protein
MLARGVVVSYETIRRWCAKFGQAYANQLRRRRPRPGDKWHLDEVFIEDQRQDPLPVARGRPARQRTRHQPRRDAKAAKKFFRRLLKGLRYVPRVLVTDKLASYQVAHRMVLTPRHHESDTVVRRGHITKQGSKLVRWAAVEAIQRYPTTPKIALDRTRIESRRGKNIAKVAAARKLLTLVYYGLRDGHIRALARRAG